MNANTANTLNFNITDELMTKVLDIQESEGLKFDEAIDHIFAKGVTYCENVIAQRAKRATADNSAKAVAQLNLALAKDPSIATDPVRFADLCIALGVVKVAKAS